MKLIYKILLIIIFVFQPAKPDNLQIINQKLSTIIERLIEEDKEFNKWKNVDKLFKEEIDKTGNNIFALAILNTINFIIGAVIFKLLKETKNKIYNDKNINSKLYILVSKLTRIVSKIVISEIIHRTTKTVYLREVHNWKLTKLVLKWEEQRENFPVDIKSKIDEISSGFIKKNKRYPLGGYHYVKGLAYLGEVSRIRKKIVKEIFPEKYEKTIPHKVLIFAFKNSGHLLSIMREILPIDENLRKILYKPALDFIDKHSKKLDTILDYF